MAGIIDSAKGMIFAGAKEKAALYILNPAYYDITDQQIGKAANDIVGKIKKGGKDEGLLDKAKNALVPAAVDKTKTFGNDLKGKSIGKVSNLRKEFIKVEVQFNPQSIRLYSGIGKQQDLERKDNGMNKLVVTNLSGKTRMSFDLIFDDVDITDAFMLEGIPVNVSQGVNKAVDKIKHGKEIHSVRKVMDAFLSLLASLKTQQVIFAWSKMTFRGTLTNVDNTFTMFNTKGNPVRGIMHIEITQEIRENSKTNFRYDKGEWDKAFKNRFKKSDSVGSKSTASKIMNNNVLNIDI